MPLLSHADRSYVVVAVVDVVDDCDIVGVVVVVDRSMSISARAGLHN